MFVSSTSIVVLSFGLTEGMTSTRGQNVSILQLRRTQPLEFPSTARRGAPINSSKIDGNAFTNGESLNQHSLEDYLTEAYGPGKSSSAYMLNSDASRSVSREFSPVHWCDRDVDEVYLGKSGWVQVQQRSLDDSRSTFHGPSRAASALRSRKFSSSFNSNVNSLERRAQNRPVNLPLSAKKRANPGNHRMPYAFTQELVTVPPPSVTPILSPPPAFRDEQIDIEIPAHPLRKSFYFDDSLHWKPRTASDSDSSPTPTSPIAKPSKSILSPTFASNHHSRPCLQTKSLDEESLERTSNDGHFPAAAPFTLFACRSLDKAFRKTNPAVVNDANSILKSFHTSEEKAEGTNQQDSEDNECDRENCSTKYSAAFQTSTRDRLTPQRDAPTPRRQRRFQLNGKRIAVNDSTSANRARSPSLDSNSSSSNSSSSSSSSGNGGGSSVGGRAPKVSSRRFTGKPSQSKVDYLPAGVSKLLSVKRSRSLQLSEERPPHELILMSHSSSGKSWDQVSSDRSTFQTQNNDNRHYPPHFRKLHNVVVAVNGQGIPVIATGGQSLNLLNEITTSEEEQLKLIREAEKEARVISEFLSGTKSRAAARSLLMHRYFNRPETPSSDFNEGDAPPKPQSDPRPPRPHKYSPLLSPHTDTPHAKPPPPPNRPYNRPITPFHDYLPPPRNHPDNLSSARSRRKHHHRQPFLSTAPSLPNPDQTSASTPTQRRDPTITKNLNARKFQTPPTGRAPTTFSENVADTPVDSQRRHLQLANCRQNSSTSSSSTDAPQHHFHQVSPSAHQISNTSDLSLDSLCLHSESFASDDNSYIRHLLHPRPASAPEIKDCTSVPPYRRSLSLPRSFLSERYAQDYFARRNSFPWRKQQPPTPPTRNGECPAKSAASGALPTTSVRHSRDDRSPRTASYNKSSYISSFPHESSLVRLQWTRQRQAATAPCSHKDRKPRKTDSTHDDDHSYNSGIHTGIRRNVDSPDFQGGPRRIKTCGFDGQDRVSALIARDIQDNQPTLQSLRNSQIPWEPLIQDPTPLARSAKGQLRRSLSLNELPPEGTQSSLRHQCRALSEDENNPFEGNSDDELSSASESSERWPPSQISSDGQTVSRYAQKEKVLLFAEAVWDHVAFESFELSFRAGDVIEVQDATDRHWWWGAMGQNSGYFPSAFVRLRVSPVDTMPSAAFEASTNLRRSKSSLLSGEQVRSNVVRELVNTEKDFVKILRDVKDGYMGQCSRRPDMFTPAQISTIFGNLDDILVFQEEFLKDLEGRIDGECPHKSCVGEAFLNHSSGFRMYSEYCNFHPMAMAALQELYQKDKYRKFFEMCRLKQNLSEIPLDGYLLTPVQRICKYPLQLAELLKYTKPDHPDYGKVEKALETMRSVATLINERKRKMERLEKLAAWQCRVEGWEGDDLIESSSQLIYQGDVVRITSGMWTTNTTLFLFDHQIIYCKKDLLKRHNYIYKGRICLDGSEVTDLADGKNQQLGVTVKYGIRISSNSQKTWLVFCCRSSEDKEKWLTALAEEKKVVAHDKEVGLDLPPTAKHLAKMVAMGTKKVIASKPRGKNKMGSNHEETSEMRDGRLRDVKLKGGRRMGNWFTFGGVTKSPKVSLRQRASFQQIT